MDLRWRRTSTTGVAYFEHLSPRCMWYKSSSVSFAPASEMFSERAFNSPSAHELRLRLRQTI